MSIALFAQANFPVDEVASALNREGLEIFSVRLDSQTSAANLPAGLEKGYLIIPKQGLDLIGEQTAITSKLVSSQIPLTLCIPEITPADRYVLSKCGASEIITPRSWSAGHIAERILGALIFAGEIQLAALGSLRGATRQIRELYYHIQKLAPLSETILILGETGTGKELVAREIHHHSGRLTEPFLPINCAELRPELMGSELFGHERGAFTDARQARKGLLLEADRGSVFLDEIGDLELKAQAQLLRVLEDRKVRPIGANKATDCHARIILATNRNLIEDCAEGKFRQDLYQRIQGFTLELPPLRERKGDIPLLVRHFVEECKKDYQQEIEIPKGALDCLFRYEWPGNVRELRAVIRRSAAYADAGKLSAAFLQEAVRIRQSDDSKHFVHFDPAKDSWRDVIARIQKLYFKAVLLETNGNKEAAAKATGLSRSHFYEKLKEIENYKEDDFDK